MKVRVVEVGKNIKLDQLLKFSGIVSTGGEAKRAIQLGRVRVNGHPVIQRGYKPKDGDLVELEGKEIIRVKVIE